MSRHITFPLAITLVCLMLVSCATVTEQAETEAPVVKQPAGWVAEKVQRQQVSNWEIRGRLGLQTEKTGGSMDIIWKQAGEDYTIRLIAPLGAGNYMIQGGKILPRYVSRMARSRSLTTSMISSHRHLRLICPPQRSKTGFVDCLPERCRLSKLSGTSRA